MGITSDIGEDILAIANEECEKRGIDLHDEGVYLFGWCYEHDNNTLVGRCSLCEGERNFPDGPLWRHMLRRLINRWLDEGEDPR